MKKILAVEEKLNINHDFNVAISFEASIHR